MKTNDRYKFTFTGAVLRFGRPICNHWEASTFAATEAKAKSNLAYRYKISNNLLPSVNIELQGTLTKA